MKSEGKEGMKEEITKMSSLFKYMYHKMGSVTSTGVIF